MREFMAQPGSRTFGLVWVGQLVSGLGSGMTRFGLALWVFLETGSAMQLSFLVLSSSVPLLLMSPFAGALVDRWDRRRAMIVSDAGAAAATVVAIVLVATGRLEVWHLYITLAAAGAFQAFQFPAYSAAITLLVHPDHYTRASGLVQLAGSVGNIVAPALAAVVVVQFGLGAIFAIDLITFGVAVVTLLVVRFPDYEPVAGAGRGPAALLREARGGLDFVTERRGLLIILVSFLSVNFAFAFQTVLIVPLLLGITTEATAGLIVSIGAGGLLVGSLAVSLTGRPHDRLFGLYAGIGGMGLGLILVGLRPTLALIALGAVVLSLSHPVAGAGSQAIWQAKVPAGMQGRVFAVRQMSAISSSPIAFLTAGWLADSVFEPLFAADKTHPLTDILGAGPGRGIGAMLALMGAFVVIVAIAAWKHPRIRNLDTEVPDIASRVPVPEDAAA
jgi:DHA3 family macrolide efflux protein-like MFS transporter